jgi:hypothetical protein
VEQQPKERFIFIPCQHCPGEGQNKQCFQKILITDTTWNKIRHFDLTSTPAPRPVNKIAPVMKDDIRPPLNDALPAPSRLVNPPQPVQLPTQPPPMIVNQLPPAFGRAGRAAMLLRMLNQQRPPLVGIRPPMPHGHSTSLGRAGTLISHPSDRHTISQQLRAQQPPNKTFSRCKYHKRNIGTHTTAILFSCKKATTTANQRMGRSELKTE